MKNMAPRGFKKEAPKSKMLVLFEFSRHRARNTTQYHQEEAEKAKQRCYLRFQAELLEKLAPKRLQKRGQKSQILGLFEFSRRRARNTTQYLREDSRKS